MLSWLKRDKNIVKEAIDFSRIGVDFHSHLIPNVDDGVDSLEETVEILLNFKLLGYTHMYTSPHIMSEGFVNTSQNLRQQYQKLISDDRINSLGIHFDLIAEYYLDEGFEKLIKENDFLTINGSYMLVEFSFNYDFPFVKDYIFSLRTMGYKLILAHPERYNFIETVDEYQSWKEQGLSLQLNLGSLMGAYGESVKKKAHQLIESNMYDFVSSDIHRLEQMNYIEGLKYDKHLKILIDSGLLKNKELIHANN